MFIYLDILCVIIFQFPLPIFCLSSVWVACLFSEMKMDNFYATSSVKYVYKKEYGNTHLVTGDLLTLSGSSVTLKKKTKMVHVRNQLANRAAIIIPPSTTTNHRRAPLHWRHLQSIHKYHYWEQKKLTAVMDLIG